jgi:ribosomal protein S18 acetylase RimI-like enzyme
MADYAAYDQQYRIVPEQAGALDGLLLHYVRDFLAVERKSEELLRELLLRGQYRILTVRSQETNACAAYLMGYPVEGGRHFFLDFFAVDPAFRGGGLGAWTLRSLAGLLGVDGLFFELEIPGEDAPPYDESVRRIGFYERLGACRLPVEYALLLGDGSLYPMHFYYLPFTAVMPDRLSVREAITAAYDYTYGVMPAACPGWRQTLADILATVA